MGWFWKGIRERERDDEVEKEWSVRDGHGGARGSEGSGFDVSGLGKKESGYRREKEASGERN